MTMSLSAPARKSQRQLHIYKQPCSLLLFVSMSRLLYDAISHKISISYISFRSVFSEQRNVVLHNYTEVAIPEDHKTLSIIFTGISFLKSHLFQVLDLLNNFSSSPKSGSRGTCSHSLTVGALGCVSFSLQIIEEINTYSIPSHRKSSGTNKIIPPNEPGFDFDLFCSDA